MSKITKLCSYMPPLEAEKSVKKKAKTKTAVNFDLTKFVCAMYADNQRLAAENARLQERLEGKLVQPTIIVGEREKEEDGNG